MAGLDSETRDMILDTLRKYADRKLTTDYLLELDHEDRFPEEVLKELYDPMQLGLHLLFIPEEYDGLGGGAYDIYRVSELMASIDLVCDGSSGNLPRFGPHPRWRHTGATGTLDGSDRQRGPVNGLRSNGATGRQRLWPP
ncbi:MAG: acyl-CoA dehydrogenase family protein [Chloroflexota bacterium]